MANFLAHIHAGPENPTKAALWLRSAVMALSIFAALCAPSGAQQPSEAMLIADFTCPTASCSTICQGIDGTSLQIDAKLVRVYQYAVHPRRVWLSADNVVYLLGDNVSCAFGGQTTIPFAQRPPVPGTRLTPPQPQCTCIGNSCTPAGCRPN